MRILLSVVSESSATVPLYVDALKQFGVDVVMTDRKETDDLTCDALVLSGGNDVNPVRYGEINVACGNLNDERDERELFLTNAYYKAKKPIMGICRGEQIINVAFGGTLVQDIDEKKSHASKSSDEETRHKITTVKGSFLNKIYGDELTVNSYHHQAINKLGKGLTVSAYSVGDNVIEGIEMKDYPLIAVQYHPERSCLTRANDVTNDSTPLFKEFIEIVKRSK